MSEALVRYERVESEAGPYAAVTLDSDHNRNALSSQLLGELLAALDRAAQDDVRAVLLAADGKAFCAGADLKEAYRDGMDKSARELATVLRAIVALPKPVVAKVHGAARAGGLGLVAACDIAVAADHVTYAFTEARLGLTPAVISLVVLPRMTPRTASRTFLTAASFDAAEAVASGLITEAVSADGLDAAVDRVLAELAQADPQGAEATKRLVNADVLAYLDAHVDDMVTLSAELFSSDAAREHLAQFLG